MLPPTLSSGKTLQMAKSNLRARPICNRKRDTIEAHLNLV